MNTRIKENAKKLRMTPTEAEKILWQELRRKNFNGCKFRRQHPMGNFVADFICLRKKLVIELDGGQHIINREKDLKRDRWFYKQGFEVVRFWNSDVFNNKEGILEAIKYFCN